MPAPRLTALVALPLALAACNSDTAAPPRRETYVRVAKVMPGEYVPTASLTGEVRARHQSDLAFRVAGRITERLVDVGALVGEGQALARIDPQEQQADLDAAEASVRAAEAQLKQASATFERQKQLIAQGFTTRRDHDAAEAAYRTALGALEAARAQAGAAQDTRGYTTLLAGVPGIITARFAEVGQVVQAAQPVFTLAQSGARDAVFAVHEALFLRQTDGAPVKLALAADPAVTATGHIREVAPSIDAATGTVRVTIGIDAPPKEMSLGAVVTGTVSLKHRPAYVVPWSALTALGSRQAVWVMAADGSVDLRAVGVIAHETGRVIIGEGLNPGETVVIDGIKLLRPGQTVTVLAGAS